MPVHDASCVSISGEPSRIEDGFPNVGGRFGSWISGMLAEQGIDDYEPDVITTLVGALQNEARRVVAEATRHCEVSLESLTRATATTQARQFPSAQESDEFTRWCDDINAQPLPEYR